MGVISIERTFDSNIPAHAIQQRLLLSTDQQWGSAADVKVLLKNRYLFIGAVSDRAFQLSTTQIIGSPLLAPKAFGTIDPLPDHRCRVRIRVTWYPSLGIAACIAITLGTALVQMLGTNAGIAIGLILIPAELGICWLTTWAQERHLLNTLINALDLHSVNDSKASSQLEGSS